jgi:hypothetical protein
MKLPFRINSKGKLVDSKRFTVIDRAAHRAKIIAQAKWALKYGKEGVDYYV